MDKIKEIKQVCIKANPDIVKLQEGCKGIWKKPESERTKAKDVPAVVLETTLVGEAGLLYIFTYDKKASNLTYRTATIFPSDFIVIGRDITLADVVHALLKSDNKEVIDDIAAIAVLWVKNKDNLDEQSEGIKDTVYSLLVKHHG